MAGGEGGGQRDGKRGESERLRRAYDNNDEGHATGNFTYPDRNSKWYR